MSKYAIDMGHMLQGYDTGAVGVGNEGIMNRQVGAVLISGLKALGHTVIDVTPVSVISLDDSLGQRVNKANANNVDFYIALHENAGGGQGCEIWAGGSAKSITMAKNVLDAIVSTGFTNRGVKIQGQSGYEHLYVLNNTNAPGILVEGCFVDSASDMKKWNATVEANAILKGLTGQTVVTPVTPIINPVAVSTSLNAQLQALCNSNHITDKNGHTLIIDGDFGSLSLSAIAKVVITRGMISPFVGWVQKKLNISSDNNYGKAPYHGTYDAIIAFQRSKGLVQDGCVGLNTWSKLVQ